MERIFATQYGRRPYTKEENRELDERIADFKVEQPGIEKASLLDAAIKSLADGAIEIIVGVLIKMNAPLPADMLARYHKVKELRSDHE
ncbi:MAG: hypothetical protein V3V84_08365 [Candidatus Bathyarchaeia archaeon]